MGQPLFRNSATTKIFKAMSQWRESANKTVETLRVPRAYEKLAQPDAYHSTYLGVRKFLPKNRGTHPLSRSPIGERPWIFS